MNNLQHICEEQHGPIFVTLNPPLEPLKDKTFGRFRYDHPVLDAQVKNSVPHNFRTVSEAPLVGCILAEGDGINSR